VVLLERTERGEDGQRTQLRRQLERLGRNDPSLDVTLTQVDQWGTDEG
jgi:hypothetical protein